MADSCWWFFFQKAVDCLICSHGTRFIFTAAFGAPSSELDIQTS